jgi:methylenetetrahydrofolate dehydrogenase (NADP+)/methenyltetrahydrofolate cyclohydrolase
MATLMMQKAYPGDCTVTVCHSRSENLKEMCLAADIIIVALGVPEFLKEDMVKKGAVIVDVGTTRMPSSVTKSGFKLTEMLSLTRWHLSVRISHQYLVE